MTRPVEKPVDPVVNCRTAIETMIFDDALRASITAAYDRGVHAARRAAFFECANDLQRTAEREWPRDPSMASTLEYAEIIIRRKLESAKAQEDDDE